MIDQLLNQEIVKGEGKIYVGRRVYVRNSFTLGINFEHGIAVLVGVLYMPPTGHALYFDEKFHPVDEKIRVLKQKYGDDWLDRYIPPKFNIYEVSGEATFTGIPQLQDLIGRLTSALDCRLMCSNSESEFGYQVGQGIIPGRGGKTVLLSHANSILLEDRCETSTSCKRVMGLEEGALLALGTAFSSLEKMSFYDFSSSYSDASERSLGESYA